MSAVNAGYQCDSLARELPEAVLKQKQRELEHKIFYVMYFSYNYNFAYGSVWVRNLVSDIKGGTQT
jgi:hypothetical protein